MSQTKSFDQRDDAKICVISSATGRTVTPFSVVLHTAEIINANDVAANEQRVIIRANRKNLVAVA